MTADAVHADKQPADDATRVTLTVDVERHSIIERLALLSYEFLKECKAAQLVSVLRYDIRGGVVQFLVTGEDIPAPHGRFEAIREPWPEDTA